MIIIAAISSSLRAVSVDFGDVLISAYALWAILSLMAIQHSRLTLPLNLCCCAISSSISIYVITALISNYLGYFMAACDFYINHEENGEIMVVIS